MNAPPSRVLESSCRPGSGSLGGSKVLLVCEAFRSNASGGLVAMRLAGALAGEGAEVQVFTRGPARENPLPPGVRVQVFEQRTHVDQYALQFAKSEIYGQFRKLVADYRPDVVHFASFENSKSRYLIEEALAHGSRVVLQPWIHAFFCEQGYDYRNGGPCGACASGRFDRALLARCAKGPVPGALHAVSRLMLRRSALSVHSVYSTNASLDERLKAYGFKASQIVRGPLPFDPARVSGLRVSEGNEYVFYGQASPIKGFHLLREISDRCPNVRFAILPSGCSERQKTKARLASGLGQHVILDVDARWDSGLSARLAGARAALLPTMWPTTTEYSLLESMGCGKPVVTFDVGSHREILRDRDNAMVAPLADVAGLAMRVEELEASPSLRAHIGENAKRTFAEITSVEALLGALERAYGVSEDTDVQRDH